MCGRVYRNLFSNLLFEIGAVVFVSKSSFKQAACRLNNMIEFVNKVLKEV